MTSSNVAPNAVRLRGVPYIRIDGHGLMRRQARGTLILMVTLGSTGRRAVIATAALAATVAVNSRTACAQVAAPPTLRVHVTDASGNPVAGANVVLLKSRTDSAVVARTDSAGQYTFATMGANSDYEITARKIGYALTTRTVQLHPQGETTVELRLNPVPTLEAVTVTDAALPTAKRAYLGAAEIAANSRYTNSLADVMETLRPDVDYQSTRCLPQPRSAPVSKGPLLPPGSPFRQLKAMLRERVYVNGVYVPKEWDPAHLIRSEDIAQVTYVNCFDHSIEDLKDSPWPRLFIVLKPGVAWDLKRGSYVDSTHVPDRPDVRR